MRLINNMQIFYDDIQIKENLLIEKGNLDINFHEINIITGFNGCGKTLLLKNIAFHLKNEKYKMILLDQNNEVTLDTGDILETIAMSDSDEIKNAVREKIKKFGCEYILDLKNGKLSGGEQRFVNILRAACSNADVLLIDEPTNDLDYNMVEKLIHVLGELKKERTIIIVSHDDRIVEIADQIFQVKEGTVFTVKKSNGSSKDTTDALRRRTKISQSFIKKFFKYNMINVFVFLILCIPVFLQVESYRSVIKTKQTISDLPENQMFICSIYSEFLGNCNGNNNNVLPAFSLQALGSLNPVEMVKVASKVTDFYNVPNIPLKDLKLESTGNYTVYPLEYITKDGQQIINVLDCYLQKYSNGSMGEVYLDTSEYFENIVQDRKMYDKSILLDINQFNNCINELECNDSLLLVAEAVVLEKRYTNLQLYAQNEFQKLEDNMACICSQDVNELYYQISFFQELMRELKIIFVSEVILLLVNLLFLKLQMTSIKKQIYLFRNFGITYNITGDCIMQKMNNRIPLLLLFLLFCVCFIVRMIDVPFSQIHFIFIFCMAIFGSVMYATEEMFIKKYTKIYYRWDAR